MLDPREFADWQIAQESEKNLPDVEFYRQSLGLLPEEIIPHGRTPKLDYQKIMARLGKKPDGHYIQITAITPTPLGEGKSTTSLGLIQGLGKRGCRVGGCLRQPSNGPTMNIKGSAAGGGNALLLPMADLSLGLTGDMDAVTNAHNLAMVALNARMQHEANYSDAELAARGLKRLHIDARHVTLGWVMDFAAQGLRNITMGLGGPKDGFLIQSRFDITASSEVMAILSIVQDLADIRARLADMIVAYDCNGDPITTADLEVDGAMAAWLRNAVNPTLCYTAEYQPCLVHAGPFANIAIGQSSVIGDRLGLKLFDYHVTESGFAADIGFEKFWNVKTRISGLQPEVSVLVCSLRALKLHGGGPPVAPGQPLPEDYKKENLRLVEQGLCNLRHHIGVIRKSGICPVVCINRFYGDTRAEEDLVRRACAAMGVRCAVSDHWLKGGTGALELADAVIDACKEKPQVKFLYDLDVPLRRRVELIAKEVYGADGVDWEREAEAKAKRFEGDPAYRDFATMMVKTHLSLSHRSRWKGVPSGWRLPIRDVLVYGGAKFLCPVAGTVRLMPGTGSDPAYRRIDIDTETGSVRGLF